MSLKIKKYFTFLGTGTSQGVPVIGCACAVCMSSDVKDKRLRTAAFISLELEDPDLETSTIMNVAIDCGPDFRAQMLQAKVASLEAILMTHEHSDHIAGIEDLRPLQFRQGKPMTIYATLGVQESLKKRYEYAFVENPYPGAVRINFETISKDSPFSIGALSIRPIEVEHADVPVLGFRFDDLTYITDCKSINQPKEFDKLKGSRILILDAAHRQPIFSHLNLEQAVEIVEKIRPEKAYFVHMSHHIGKHEDVNKELPAHINLAWDGLSFEF